jgi:O-antigen/teichoic acid export membrane protein
MNRSGSLARNVLSNYLVLAASLAYALAITPVVVGALDKEQYGVWSFLNGLLTYSELLYLGLGSAVIKYVAQYRANDDLGGINRLVSVVLTIYAAIGIALFAFWTLMSGVIPRAFAEPLSAGVFRTASITCVLLGAQLLFVFVGSAFAGLFSGYDRYDILNGINLLGLGGRFIAVPLLVRPEREPLLMLAAVTAASTALQSLLLTAAAFRYVQGLSLRPVRPRLDELRWLYGFGIQSFFIVLSAKLISYTDTTVIGVTLGAVSVALYVLPLQLVEYARAFVASFYGVLLPRLTVLVTRGEMARVREAYLSATRIAGLMSGWILAGLIGLGPAFLNRWVGPEFGTPVQWVIVYLAIAMFGQILTSQVSFAFYQALHRVAFPALVLTIEAGVNLGLSLFFAPRLGITGVALATALPALLVTTVALAPYLCRRLDIALPTFFLSSVLPGLSMAVATLASLWVADWMLPGDSYRAIVSRMLCTVPAAVLLFRLTIPEQEQRALWQRLRLSGAR